MIIKDHTRIDLAQGGTRFKQGDFVELAFTPRDAAGKVVDLTGKDIEVSIWNRSKGVIYQGAASFDSAEKLIRVTIKETLDHGKFQIEFTVTDSTDADYRRKFPSDEYNGVINITPSTDNMDVVGVQMTTVTQLRNEQQQLQQEFESQVLPRVDTVEGKQTQLEADYQAAAGALTEDSEVILARKGEPTLRAFNDKVVAQLAGTVKKDEGGTIGYAMLKQDVREQFTGGNTAIVGEDSVLTENIVDRSVSLEKQNFLKISGSESNLFDGNFRKTWVDTTTGVYSYNNATSLALIPIQENKTYKVRVQGAHDRFVVSLLKTGEIGEVATILWAITSGITGDDEYQFRNANGNTFLAIGVSGTNQQPIVEVTTLNENTTLRETYKKNLNGTYVNRWYNYTTGVIGNAAAPRSIITPVSRNAQITIETKGAHARFIIAGITALNVADSIYLGSNGDGTSTGDEKYSFYNTNYDYLILGLSDSTTTPEDVFLYEDTMNEIALMTDGIPENSVDTKSVKDSAISYLKQSFVEQSESRLKIKLSDQVKQINISENYKKPVWINYLTQKIVASASLRTVIYPLEGRSRVEIQTTSSHDRFLVALANNDEITTPLTLLTAGINGDGSSTGNENFIIEDTSNFKYLVISASTVEIDFPIQLTVRPKDIEIFRDEAGTGITELDTVYPVLFGVKSTNANDGKLPHTAGWLYYSPVAPYDIYYANGDPRNLKRLCSWRMDLTYKGIYDPSWYRPFITKDGDIIFVFRGDALGTTAEIVGGRQNPIVYPANDWNNPVVVDFGSDLKPTAWLQNCGADYLYNEDVFMFSEYTRPHHLSTNVWRVTKPFTDPNNWNAVESITIDADVEHSHTIQYDPLSGEVFWTTGDSHPGSRIYVSEDKGLTFSLKYSGSRRKARVLNFVALEGGAYWASDDTGSSHAFNFAPRVNGSIDFTQISELYDLSAYPPTYANVYVKNESVEGVLILNRFDNPQANGYVLDVLFWDIETSTMHTVASFEPVESNKNFGFRMEAVNFYPPKHSDAIALGIANPENNIDLLGNGSTKPEKVNNYTLGVVKSAEGFALTVSTVAL